MGALLDIEKMLGKMMMVGFDGYTVPDSTRHFISNHHIGGVILFKNNISSPKQLKQLTAQLRSISPDIFIAVDQEGGRVSRLHFYDYKSSRELATSGSCEATSLSYLDMAGKMKSLGINLDFAPVLDVDTNPENPVIGDRAFGRDPDTVAEHGNAAILALENSGIIACGKHFPGHGDTKVDSHMGLPVIPYDIKRLEKIELLPFKMAISCGVSSIMTAHILFPAIDNIYPATLSEKIVNGLLRKSMGFDNIIFTDDMEMGAITENYPIEKASLLSVLAGVDIVLVCKSLDRQVLVFEHLLKSAVDKLIPEDRIRNSCFRIMRIKEKFGISHG